METTQTRTREPDPLYDAPNLIFVWALWLFVSWGIGNSAGLVALVLGTVGLTAFALRHDRGPEPRSFAADFATVLLFCAAAIGVGVFVVVVLSDAPVLLLVMGLFAASATILIRLAT